MSSFFIESEDIIPLESSKLFTAILESSYDGIWISCGKGNTLFVNKAYERITGLKREDVVGKNIKQVLKENYFYPSSVLSALESKQPVSLILKYKTGKHALATGNPVFDSKGDIVRVVCNVRDITELTNLKNQLAIVKELSNRYAHELQQARKQQLQHETIASKSIAMSQIIKTALKVAPYNSTILILGESGVGKGVLAKFIHNNSLRKNKPFINVNCAAMPYNLIESELFGYVEGSFTGALKKGKLGYLELANEGTILLDEIGELPIDIQAKLLKAIEKKEIYRLGSESPTKLDIRILAATNKNLEEEATRGGFRKDLFFRINVVPITIPPLRERKEDIPELANYFIKKHNLTYNKSKHFSSDVVDIFYNYSWPGNVRELENLIEYLFIISSRDEIGVEQLPPQLLIEHVGSKNKEDKPQLRFLMDNFEEVLIRSALKKNPSLRKTAFSLGIDPSTLSRKIKKYQIKI